MKKLFLILILIVIETQAQERIVGDFYKVTVFDQIDLLLIQSNENKILLNGPNSEEVEIINKNGELKIRLPLTMLLAGDGISATLYFKNVSAVEANEGSRISSESTIVSSNFDLIAKEGSIVSLPLDVQNLKVKMNDGSKVTLNGTAVSQDVLLNSGSIYSAQKLNSETAIITANTGAEGSIRVSEMVEAKSRAGGKLNIYGKPKRINQKTIAGGKIFEKAD